MSTAHTIGFTERSKSLVTFFRNEAAKTQRVEHLTLEELRDKVLSTAGSDKKSLPWLKLARFGEERSDRNCLRTNINTLGITGAELDYDSGKVSFEAAVEVLRRARLYCLIYTSASHTVLKPRWRIVAPTSRELPPAERAKMVARIVGLFPGVEFDHGSFTLSLAFHYGHVNGSADHQAIAIEGEFVDLRPDLDAVSSTNAPSLAEASTNPFLSVDQGFKPPIDVDARLAAMVYGGEGDDGVHQTQLQVTASLMNAGWEVDAAVAKVLEATKKIGDPLWDWKKEESDIRGMCLDWRRKHPVVGNKIGTNLVQWRDRAVRGGKPLATMRNARLGIAAMGITCRHDLFRDVTLIGFEGDAVVHEVRPLIGEVTSVVLLRLRSLFDDRYGFDPEDKHILDAVKTMAFDSCFDPILDMLALAEANWDGTPRLDAWLVTYVGTEDTKLNRAMGRKWLIAAVRRARHPGCKFDNILVLEGIEGILKSMLFKVLAGEDFFSDQSILGASDKEIQEQLTGVWIHESADLAGMTKAEVAKVKAFASRTHDRARPAYGRVVERHARRSIEAGSTNDDEYLQSQTGNRRFWPILAGTIDIEALKRDRLQLWGEAAACEIQGESLVLDPSLWPDAAKEQEKRRVKDPWEDILKEQLEPIYAPAEDGDLVELDPTAGFITREDGQDRVASSDLLKHVLDIPSDRQTIAHGMRLANAMKAMKATGWTRPTNGLVAIGGKQVRGYFRWASKWETEEG